jgi:hypothetical protein
MTLAFQILYAVPDKARSKKIIINTKGYGQNGADLCVVGT